ncbi:MAG: RNA polymerase sigma factor [Egibacteraceae bacterium]
MLLTELEDHRRSAEPILLDALQARDPLALAEIYHRTVPAAHACVRRLLSPPARIEALLRTVYLELWENPPKDVPLEGWIRGRCFALAADDLRAHHTAPASPSAATLLPDLPAPDVRYLDAIERCLSELGERERMILLLAHDCGVDTAAQGGDAAEALDLALLELAGPETSSADAAALRSDPCPDGLWMGDWVLGLVDHSIAQEFEAFVASRPGCAARARALRRGRRRLEGLPPTPDMGQRILVTVVLASPVSAAQPEALGGSSLGDEDQALWLPPTAGTWPRDDPGDASTGELAQPESGRGNGVGVGDELSSVDLHVEPEPAIAPQPDGRVTITEPVTAVSVSMPDSASATGDIGIRARRRNPYAELVDLDDSEEDFELPDPHRVGPTAPVTVEPDTDESSDRFESFYPEEEFITLPSAGQRVLVVLGYVLPILLGAGLGLFLADLLFTR